MGSVTILTQRKNSIAPSIKKRADFGLILLSFTIFNFILPSIVFAQQWKEQIFGTENPDFKTINFFEVQKNADSYFKNVREELQKKGGNGKEDFEGNSDPMHRAYFEYNRWVQQNQFLVKEDSTLANPIEAYYEYQNYLSKSSTEQRAQGITANWKSINRTTALGAYYGMGATRCIQFHPTDVKTFWVSADGGIWKTTNGGTSYTPVGDNLPYILVGSFCVDPSNVNIIYALTGVSHSWGSSRSFGIFKTTNGGTSWSPAGLNGSLVDNNLYGALVMNPVNPLILLAGCFNDDARQGIYRTADGGNTWTKVLSGVGIRNLTYKPNDGNILYAAAGSNSGSFYRSTDGGLTWNVVKAFTDNGYSHGIAASAVNTSHVAMIHEGNGTKELWVSTNSGLTWTKGINFNSSSYIWGNLAFSALDANTIYPGYMELYKSTDLGKTMGAHITSYYDNGEAGVAPIHADFTYMKVNPLDKKLYTCNDGGVAVFDESVQPYGKGSWKELNNGLIITHYLGVGGSQIDPNLYGAGGQDNGSAVHKPDGTWINCGMGDASSVFFDPHDVNTWYSTSGNVIERTTTGNWVPWLAGALVSNNIPASSATGAHPWYYWSQALAFDPIIPNVIISGVCKDVWRSTNKGDTWQNIGANLAGGKTLAGVAIAPSNSNVIYTHHQGGSIIYVTKNGGTNWSNYSLPSTTFDIFSIAVHNTKPGTIWVSGNNWITGTKVYKSIDYGATWTNESGTLPNLPALSVIYDKSTDGLYVSMYHGVYYKNSTMSDWINFGQGLPNAHLFTMDIQNTAKKLRIASEGRGIWETDLYSLNTGLESISSEKPQITASPNPSNGIFLLEIGFPDNGSYTLEIVNPLGQVMFQELLNISNSNYNYSKDFSIAEIPKGNYFVKIISKTSSESISIIIK